MPSRRGVWIFLLLFTLLGTAVLFAAWSLRTPSEAPTDVVLVYEMPIQMDESEAPSRGFLSAWSGPRGPFLGDIVAGLDRAAHDDRVRGLALEIDLLDWGWAKSSELRDAVQAFRATGKPVIAQLLGGGDMEYYVASAADIVTLPPQARLHVDGLSASSMFLGGALNKLDVRANFVRAGVYKSAPEEYTRTDLSPAAREALERVLDDLYSILVDTLATARDLDRDDMVGLLDSGPFTAQEAWEAGLVDTLMHRADLDSLIALNIGEDIETMDFEDYSSRRRSRPTGDRIAVIHASGTIVPGTSRDTPGERILGSETLVENLSDARTRDAIKAVVLRIDSPGGVMQAADDVWREARRLGDEKPLIVSMSDVAASGGYYIAAPARLIVAQPSTITGSIGVYVGKFNISGLMNKLGINIETVSRGAHAGMLSPYRDFTEEEREWLQGETDELYRVFLDRVAEGRGMDVPEVDAVAQGRVWTGVAAHELGLVDTLGGLPLAIEIAREAAQLADDSPIEVMPRVEHPWYQRFFDNLFSDEAAQPSGLDVTEIAGSAVLKAWLTVSRLHDARALALMPWSIEIR
jgi:protease IV